MKMVTETLNRSEFRKCIIDDAHNFRSHVFRISCQFKEQRNIKENLPDNHVPKRSSVRILEPNSSNHSSGCNALQKEYKTRIQKLCIRFK